MLADPYDNYYLSCMEQQRKFTQFITGLILIIGCITVMLAACTVWGNNQQSVRKIVNLRPVHKQIIRLLGPQVQACYLIDCQI